MSYRGPMPTPAQRLDELGLEYQVPDFSSSEPAIAETRQLWRRFWSRLTYAFTLAQGACNTLVIQRHPEYNHLPTDTTQILNEVLAPENEHPFNSCRQVFFRYLDAALKAKDIIRLAKSEARQGRQVVIQIEAAPPTPIFHYARHNGLTGDFVLPPNIDLSPTGRLLSDASDLFPIFELEPLPSEEEDYRLLRPVTARYGNPVIHDLSRSFRTAAILTKPDTAPPVALREQLMLHFSSRIASASRNIYNLLRSNGSVTARNQTSENIFDDCTRFQQGRLPFLILDESMAFGHIRTAFHHCPDTPKSRPRSHIICQNWPCDTRFDVGAMSTSRPNQLSKHRIFLIHTPHHHLAPPAETILSDAHAPPRWNPQTNPDKPPCQPPNRNELPRIPSRQHLQQDMQT